MRVGLTLPALPLVLAAQLALAPGVALADEGRTLTEAQIRTSLVGKNWDVGNGEPGTDWQLLLGADGIAVAITGKDCERSPFAIRRGQLCSNPNFCFVVQEYPEHLPGHYVLWPDGDPMATPLILTLATKTTTCPR